MSYSFATFTSLDAEACKTLIMSNFAAKKAYCALCDNEEFPHTVKKFKRGWIPAMPTDRTTFAKCLGFIPNRAIFALLDSRHFDSGTFSGCRLLKSVNFINTSMITRIGNDFLSNCTTLCTVPTVEFASLEHIGNNFLAGNKSLTYIKFGKLPILRTIGDNFLSQTGIVNVSIKANKLKSIGSGAFRWSDIDTLKLEARFLTTIENSFCTDTPVRTVSIIATRIHEIGNDAFARNSNLSDIRITGLKINHIGDNFCLKSPISTLNMRLHRVKTIGSNFMSETNMKDILMFLPMIRKAGDEWFRKCKDLTTCRVEAKYLAGSPNSWFSHCPKLDTVELTAPLMAVRAKMLQPCLSATTVGSGPTGPSVQVPSYTQVGPTPSQIPTSSQMPTTTGRDPVAVPSTTLGHTVIANVPCPHCNTIHMSTSNIFKWETRSSDHWFYKSNTNVKFTHDCHILIDATPFETKKAKFDIEKLIARYTKRSKLVVNWSVSSVFKFES